MGSTISASSFYLMTPPGNITGDILQARWETDGKVIGAWLEIHWAEKQRVKELWIKNKAEPYDIVLDPYMRTGNYYLPKLISIEFSDKTTVKAELKRTEKYQIITLPKLVETSSLKFLVQEVWTNSGKDNTGMCKIRAFAQDHAPCFNVKVLGMYDVRDKQPVQSARIELINPTDQSMRDAVLAIFDGKHKLTEIALDEIPAKSSYAQQLWIQAPFKETECRFVVKCSRDLFKTEQTLVIRPYRKSYFDGGDFNILPTNHNDLGWLDIQSVTADYRSAELILPAMDMLKKYPEFKYTMESVEYLKEFLKRHPEKKDEMAKFMRERRFVWGASYVQCLQVHVGPEKLIRQFYCGKRWLKENFPGCDSRVYINTDVPGLTYQLPQILRKSGIDYIVQGRFPWGFYYWEGLDGTSIPVFAFRYDNPYRLLNPKNNEGWSKFADEREYYYKPRKLPKSMLYDFNSDYLPPCEDLVPFARQQNKAMQEFASLWNESFIKESEKQIHPPKIRFVEPETALDNFFGQDPLDIETVKGDWPMSWAYYDEPANREGLLMGRKGHNSLIAAEMMYSLLSVAKNDLACPRDKVDEGWLANCWPDHGWGGNRGTVTDSFYVESYKKSQRIGMELVRSAGNDLLARLAPGKVDQLPILVFNSLNWERTDFVTCEIQFPKHWSGCKLISEEQKDTPFEIIQSSPRQNILTIAFYAENVPALGYKTYYAQEAPLLADRYPSIASDSLENQSLKVKVGKGGITSFYDKIRQKEILKTDRFLGGEIIEMAAPDMAWESLAKVTMDKFDKTSRHDTHVTRAVASPIRYLIEQETFFDHFTLRERFILGKQAKELQVEVDIVNLGGKRKSRIEDRVSNANGQPFQGKL